MMYKYWPTEGSTERNDKLSLPVKNREPFYLISATSKIHLKHVVPVEQHALKNTSSCWNTKITFFLETSGGQNYNI